MTRRDLLAGFGAAAGLAMTRPTFAAEAPAPPVVVTKCRSYGAELLPALERTFDQLGGIGRLVKGKTVVLKVNLTGDPDNRLGHIPAELAHWTHPAMIGAATHLFAKAGARRVRIVECAYSTAEPLEEFIMRVNWDPQPIIGAGSDVSLVNTNWLGGAKKYSELKVPGGGYMFPRYFLNQAYEDCDVFVSMAKMKEHATCGVTLSMKNCFGITPCTIYGEGAGGKGEPTEYPQGGRGILHIGNKQPAGQQEIDEAHSNDPGHRVPRVVADLVAARPIDLAIIDGIATMTHGEGPWCFGVKPAQPGVIVAGTNCVSTDAVATAVMGFEPGGSRGAKPFEQCDNHMLLAEQRGIGSCDLKRIEVRGVTIAEALFPFRKA